MICDRQLDALVYNQEKVKKKNLYWVRPRAHLVYDSVPNKLILSVPSQSDLHSAFAVTCVVCCVLATESISPQ